MTFAKGASLEDPSSLFNASLEGNARRAIDIHSGDEIDEAALKALIRAAVALNLVLASGYSRRALAQKNRGALEWQGNYPTGNDEDWVKLLPARRNVVRC